MGTQVQPHRAVKSARPRGVSHSILVPDMLLTDSPKGEWVEVRLVPDFGERLKRARKAAGLTQIKLGQAIGFDEKHSASTVISAIEAGRTIPSPIRARLLCEVVGIPLAEMLERVP
jgi:ribosome-binding protein aMBF1 (putative translation factor)